MDWYEHCEDLIFKSAVREGRCFTCEGIASEQENCGAFVTRHMKKFSYVMKSHTNMGFKVRKSDLYNQAELT